MIHNKKSYLIFFLFLIIAAFFTIIFFTLIQDKEHSQVRTYEQVIKKHSPFLTKEKINKSALSRPNDLCSQWEKKYESLFLLKTKHSPLFRFSNTHKKIGPTIYRLRHFFKDGDEGEIESYLVYQEDQNETARIVEKSIYKKGILYNKIESTPGESLFTEEGLSVEDDLFLLYENNKLKSIQAKTNECLF